MINLFQITPGDASMQYLGRIFGNVSGVISINGQSIGESINILSTMFKVFNGVVLTIAVLMLVYITIVGVVATAHEGEAMGQKWKSIWIPIRAVLGFALLVPTGAGYCGLQIIMMWVIVQGVGAADVLWGTALKYVNVFGSVYAQVSLPSIKADTALSGLFQGLACDATARMAPKASVPADPDLEWQKKYFCAGGDSWCAQNKMGTPATFNDGGGEQSFGPGGSCGKLTYCNQQAACQGAGGASSLACLVCQAQHTALTNIIPTLSAVGMEMANADYSYRVFYTKSYTGMNDPSWRWIAQSPYCKGGSCCVASNAGTSKCPPGSGSSFPKDNELQNANIDAVKNIYWPYWPQLGQNLGLSTNVVQTAVNYYMDLAQGALTTYIAAQANKESFGNLQNAADWGWILAGAYYYEIANQNANDFKDSLSVIEWDASEVPQGTMKDYRNNYQASQNLIIAANEQAASQQNSGGRGNNGQSSDVTGGAFNNSNIQSIGNDVNSSYSSISNTFQASVSGQGGNPLVWITALGQTLLWVAGALFIAMIALIWAVGIVGYLDVYVLGTGVVNPIGPTFSTFLIYFIPFMFAIMGIMVTAGGLLAVYTPLIPFVIFAMGAISWLISTVEAMVAGPLVALGIISPSGQHELLGEAAPALMLLFNIFLRPSLMIFGLIAAMLLATVVMDMINAGFRVVFAGGSVAHDPIGLTMLLCVYIMLVITALNKCFAVINILPQKVTAWAGGQQGEAVDAELGAVKGGAEAAGGQAAAGMSGAKEKEMEDVGAKRKTAIKEEKAKKKAAAAKAEKGGESPGE